MTTEGTTAVAPAPAAKVQISTGNVVAIIPQTFDEVYRMATLIVKSGIGPKGLATVEAAAVAIMAGAEVGVSPMAAVQNIAVVNGRPCMWGDLVVALIQASGKLEYLIEEWDDKTQTATARVKRIGKPERVETFGPEQAKRAGLSNKDLYKTYPQRMHGWRAKTYAIRAEFADVLKGLSVREEVEDYIDVEAVPTRTLPPMPGKIVEAEAGTEPPEPGPEATESDDTGRTIEDEIREVGECLGKKGVEINALIKQHAKAKTLETLRDLFRAEYQRRPAEG